MYGNTIKILWFAVGWNTGVMNMIIT